MQTLKPNHQIVVLHSRASRPKMLWKLCPGDGLVAYRTGFQGAWSFFVFGLLQCEGSAVGSTQDTTALVQGICQHLDLGFLTFHQKKWISVFHKLPSSWHFVRAAWIAEIVFNNYLLDESTVLLSNQIWLQYICFSGFLKFFNLARKYFMLMFVGVY